MTAGAITALLALMPVPAAAETDAWASWGPVTGDPNDYRATVRQAAPGFPAAGLATDSRGGVQVAGGTSTFLSADTPPGAEYGSSRGNPYLVLRPRADTPTAPSTSTYTFAHPTPGDGWAFVLGDVDADRVRVDATDAAGDRVPDAAVDRWFQGTFNYAGDDDEPRWDADSATLVGNEDAADTDGAAGWFEPDRRLTSLTLTFTRRAGFPVYQTWFVSRARSVTGQVTDSSPAGSSCDLAGTRLVLRSPDDEVVARTTADGDGLYGFVDVATQGGYVVRATPPEDCTVVGTAERAVDTRGSHGSSGSRADFAVREVVPQPISGTVRDTDGAPVRGVDVTLTRPDDDDSTTTTTGTDGTYLFDGNDEVAGYSIGIAVPDGYRPGPGGATIDGVDVGDRPVVDQDFALVELATVSGRVTGGGGGLGGVRVTLDPVGRRVPLATVTDERGRWRLAGVPAGDYRLAVDAPRGYTGGGGRAVTVGDDDLRSQDVALARPGALGGRVIDDDGAVDGVRVLVSGPGRTRRLTTDADGRYFLDGLRPGTYTVRVVAPDGQEVVGGGTATAVITRAGEVRGGRDFVLDDEALAPLSATGTTAPSGSSPSVAPTASATTSATPTPTSSASASPVGATTSPGTTSTGVLPDTGGPAFALVLLAGGLIAGGGALLVVGRRGRSRGTDEPSTRP